MIRGIRTIDDGVLCGIRQPMRGRRVLFLGSGRDVPATLYRILPYLPRLRKAGLRCDLAQSHPDIYGHYAFLGWRASQRLRRWIRRVQLAIARVHRYDVIVLSRELFNDPTSDLEGRFRAETRRFILDVDDAVFQRFPEKFARIASIADVVLAGNSRLAEVSRNYCRDVRILPTAVELNDYPALTVRPLHDPVVVGWIGTESNLPFLEEALPALEALSRQHPLVLRVVTNRDASVEQFRRYQVDIELRPWSSRSAVEEITQFDVGIMPLPDNQWTQYKCGFKLLQYMAAGVPSVASPVGVNREIIAHGESGFLAGTPEEWTASLATLMTDMTLRRSVATQARQRVEHSYSVEACLPTLLAAIDG